jgi:hypothetical protein
VNLGTLGGPGAIAFGVSGDGRVIVGSSYELSGEFDAAKWTRACPADLDCSGGVDSDDVIRFFTAWDAGDLLADFTGDGGVDGDDTIAFFGRWDSGC